MATQNEHGRLIAAAAKAALSPIGCTRCGQSRVWLSDQRYWAIMIEFQPSGFSKGTYLNVGASWLWYERPGMAFNVGYRVAGADFIPFQNAAQFGPLVEKMAARAAEEVLAMRVRFSSIAAISRYLCEREFTEAAQIRHTAIAAALNGEFDGSRRFFQQIQTCPIHFDVNAKIHSDAAAVAALLDDPAQFRSAVRRIIDARRAQARLPPLADCLEGVNSTAAR
ncbi:MAG: hypothetical protein ABR878_17950 [Roseiarcus sp.]|jgi:hypothetical protein